MPETNFGLFIFTAKVVDYDCLCSNNNEEYGTEKHRLEKLKLLCCLVSRIIYACT